MIRDLKFLLSTFSRRDRALLAIYVLAQFGLSVMDLVGIAMVLPILQIVSGAPLDEGYLALMHGMVGEPSREVFVLLLTGGMVVAFTLKSVLGVIAGWWSTGLVGRLQALTASRLLRAYLAGSYIERRGSTVADLSRLLDVGVSDAHGKVLANVLGVATSMMATGVVLVFLFAVQPVPTAIALSYFGIAVFAMQRLLGERNRTAGKAAIAATWARGHAIVDLVNGFREIRMHNAESVFAERFDRSNARAIQVARKANLYASIPKYALELITIIGIALLLAVSVTTMDATELMTVMGLFVAVAIRLLPTVSGLTAQLGTLRSGQPGLALVADELRRLDGRPLALATEPGTATAALSAMVPETLEVENVHFRYPSSDHDVLEEISFTVPPGTSLALLGLSGSGKTTLVDLILGLHTPRAGAIRYGDRSVHDLGTAWRDLVAYVPQDVYIVDDTILTNVAFGEPVDEVDEERVLDALRRASLLDFVNELPDGVRTHVGGRGTRLSGGQRQRLGIARALYRNPSIIVLDEATSALDNKTEHEVAEAIAALRGEVTTIQIAHRLSTVRNADQVVYLQNGQVAATGTFDEVRSRSAEFAQLVALGNLDADLGAESTNGLLEGMSE